MDPRAVLAGCLLGIALLRAQPEEPRESPLSPGEEAVEQLLSVRESPEAMQKAIADARAAKVSEQAILEARFLFHVDRAEDKEIAAMLPEFAAFKDRFKLVDSEIFASTDDWLAVTEYVRALAALENGDKDGFKRHITEAFWLSPRQGAAFAPHIERIRLMDAMKDVRIDFENPYIDTLGGEPVTLRTVLGERKGLLLHFWSPWSRECEATLADFFITADHLVSKDVAVASVLPETSDKVIADAKGMLEATGMKIPGAWLVDGKKNALSVSLKVQTVPVVVLISPQGNVLFNGHPTDEEFWSALEKINPEIMRPEMREEE
ncbi:MAG: hypothetical protein RLZZ505_1811 [Verrucomicrobiota bacterium]|jgi:hypothetical protein